MRYFELCEKSERVAKEIMETPDFLELLSLKERISNEIGDLVLNFNKAKENYDEVVKYSSYHPDLKKRQLELVKAKEALYTNELVKRYKEIERKIQKELNDVAQKIAASISSNVKKE